MADITKNAVYVPSIRVWLLLQDWRSYHTVSVQISPPQYSMCKNAFSASETTILSMWLYLLCTPSVFDVTLMRIYEVAQNGKFSIENALFS